MKLIAVLLATILVLTTISEASAQTDPLTISMSEQNWDSNMKNLKEITSTTGLTLQINIQNTGSSFTASISGLTIQYQLVDNTNPPQYNQGPQTLANYQSLVVPNGTTVPIYLTVWQPGTQEQYGDYSLKVTYSCGYVQWSGPTNTAAPQSSLCTSSPTDVVPYPLDFKVVSDSQLQNDIQNQRTQTGAPVVVINSPLVVFGSPVGLITAILVIVGAIVAYWLKKRK